MRSDLYETMVLRMNLVLLLKKVMNLLLLERPCWILTNYNTVPQNFQLGNPVEVHADQQFMEHLKLCNMHHHRKPLILETSLSPQQFDLDLRENGTCWFFWHSSSAIHFVSLQVTPI